MASLNMALWYTLFLSFFTITNCFVLFPDETLQGYDDKCADALATNVTACLDGVAGINPNDHFSTKGLDILCSENCRAALTSWEQDVVKSCPGVSYTNEWGHDDPISAIPSKIAFNFKQTCFKQDGQYCNVVIGNLTETGGDPCNMCLLQKLRNLAQFPYGSGPEVRTSRYPEFTSSCGFTGHPITGSPSPTASIPTNNTTPSSSVPATPTPSSCSGKKYTIKDGDDCFSIAESQGVATFQLLMDNQLTAYCHNFPKKGELCIKNQCDVYTVQEGDTCKSVAKAHNITTVQLRSYNPWIDGGCYNFHRTIGTQLCMNEPGDKYVPPSTPIGAPPTATAPVTAPTNVAANTTKECGKYYEVNKGEDCSTILMQFALSREDFGVLNPSINENCTNLLFGISYCVMPVGDINDYPNAPGNIGAIPSYSAIPWDSLPEATYVPHNNPEGSELAPGTDGDCEVYAEGRDLQYNFPGTSQCAAAKAFWNFEPKDLLKWNPSLRASSNSTAGGGGCSFDKTLRYCMYKGDGAVTPPTSTPPITTPVPTPTPTPTETPQPTSPPPTSTPSTSTESTSTTEPTTTSSSPTTTSSGSVPSPTQSDSIPENCNRYEKVEKGDNCMDFAKDNDITEEQLYEWNTILGEDGKECNTMFQAGYYYCIGVDA